ncbi:helix-turn-helix domain-containing protein [Acetobacter sp.]|uniref:helix-turn-helix domain-containing protein n=1 Tax=Acetobacter sp. TaxID=440 RepID=UPI00345B93EA
MLEYVAKQFRNNTSQTSSNYHCSGSQRLFCYLVKLSIIQDNRKKVVLPHSKSLVAAELCITPENLSRIITRFRGEILEVNGSEITILNYAQLISLCGHIRA